MYLSALAGLRHRAVAAAHDPDSLSISVFAFEGTHDDARKRYRDLGVERVVLVAPRLAVDTQGSGPLLVFLQHRTTGSLQGCAGFPATCCVALGIVCHPWYSRKLGAMTTGPSTGLRSLSRGVRTCSHTLRNHNPAWQERRPLCGIAPSPRSTIWQRSFSPPAACVGRIPRVSLRES